MQKGRSTLTARASRTIKARGTLVSVVRPSFDQRQRKIQALSPRQANLIAFGKAKMTIN